MIRFSILLASSFLLFDSFALTRTEIIERFRSPVVTQANGLVQVFANCSEDMRREYQMPIASFAAETVKSLYRGTNQKPVRFAKPGIVIHLGDVRTNLPEVVEKVSTNDSRVVTRLYVRSPGSADLGRLRLGVIRGFFRCVVGRELGDAEAIAAYRQADPVLRVADERQMLEDWLVGKGDLRDDEEGLRLMRKIIKPGTASRRDVLIFASRLYLYPPDYDLRFMGRFSSLSFREALKFGRIDPTIGLMAVLKARELPLMGGGRGKDLAAAAEAYRVFLEGLGKKEKDVEELGALLDDADEKLNIAFERVK